MSIRAALLTFFALVLTLSAASVAEAQEIQRASLPAPPRYPTCSLERYVGVSYEDAVAVEEVLCSEANSRNEHGVLFKVRVTRLGHQNIVRLVVDRAGNTADRQLIVSNLDEISVAAPRLVTSTLADSPIAETQTVDNVVGGEVRTAKSKKSLVHGTVAVVGAGMMSADPGAGVAIGIEAGDARWSFVTDLRLTGDAFESSASLPLQVLTLGLWKPKLDASSSFGSLSGGVRHHFSAESTALFTGMGIGLDHYGFRKNGADLENTGLGTFVEVGLDVLRTSSVGGAVSLRLDAPLFAAKGTRTSTVTDPRDVPHTEHLREWSPVASVAFAMRF